jgi:hypothetical protein
MPDRGDRGIHIDMLYLHVPNPFNGSVAIVSRVFEGDFSRLYGALWHWIFWAMAGVGCWGEKRQPG